MLKDDKVADFYEVCIDFGSNKMIKKHLKIVIGTCVCLICIFFVQCRIQIQKKILQYKQIGEGKNNRNSSHTKYLTTIIGVGFLNTIYILIPKCSHQS